MRHGETAWNAENRILGSTDIPLNENGREQAREAAKELEGMDIDVIYTSCLSRAMETGLAVAALQKNCKVFHEPCLNEHDFGEFEGKDRCSEEYQSEKRKCFKRYPGGESFLDVAARVYPFVKNLLADPALQDKTVFIVSHGGICRVISSLFRDMENEEFVSFAMRNCGYRLVYSHSMVADGFGERS